MAEDTYSVLKKIGLDKFRVMGVSLGGMIVETIALKHPESVESLVLCSTTSRVEEENKELFETWKKLAEEKDLNSLMESFGENIYSPAFYEQYKDIIISSGDWASDLDYRNFITSIDAIMSFIVYGELENIKCPVSVLGAGKDRVLGTKATEDMIDKLGCVYYIYEDGYHGVYDEAADYRSRIKEFLDRN